MSRIRHPRHGPAADDTQRQHATMQAPDALTDGFFMTGQQIRLDGGATLVR